MNKELEKIDTTVIVEAKTVVLDELSKQVNAIVIENDTQFGKANDLLKAIKKQRKEAENTKLKTTEPYRNFVSDINIEFKKITSKADEIKESLSTKIVAYDKILKDKRIKEAEDAKIKELADLKEAQELADLKAKLFESPIQEKKAEAIEKVIEKKIDKPVKIASGFKTENSSTSVTEYWTYEITEPELVPKHLCSPDPVKVNKAIKEGLRTSFGLRIFKKPRVNNR